MKFNKFFISIVSRIILIVCTCFLFVFFSGKDDLLLTSIFLVFLIIIQIVFLIRYVNRTNRELAEFLIHLQQGDTSVVFSKENIEKTFKGLRSSFEKINTDFRDIKTEKAQKEQYLDFIINNVKTGLLATDETGNIEFVNNQAKIFLNKKNHRLSNINTLDDEFVKIFKKKSISEIPVLKKTINDELFYLAFNLSEFKINNKLIRLFSIHDVKKEIESNEVESWQKLTSVLTHEMMNSITPITSLAHAIKRYLKNDIGLKDKLEISNELISDIVDNADLIENRGKGLLEFINNYRTITKLPKPKFEKFNVKPFLQKIILLFNKEINENEIEISLDVNPESLALIADIGMIEQVIINLIKNSIESFTKNTNPKIEIKATFNNNQKTIISLMDNGNGIEPEIMDNIFVPFFTTKEKGSGIGLSLSRQIMHLHGGNIFVRSEPNKETIFTLHF